MEIQPAGAHERPQALGRSAAEVALLRASRPYLGRIEADEPHVRVDAINLDRVAVDDADVGGLDRLRRRRQGQQQRGDDGGSLHHSIISPGWRWSNGTQGPALKPCLLKYGRAASHCFLVTVSPPVNRP
jgi:hypothetical protein